MKISVVPVMMMISVLFISSTLIPYTFGTSSYAHLYEWGSFGISKPGSFSYPQFITMSENGTIFVSDFGNKRIQKFLSTGEYVLDWGKSGKQPGEFYSPSGIVANENFVFVADRDLNRIQKFSTDGEFISAWGQKGTGKGQFLYPNGVSIYHDRVYVVDTGNQRIQVFSSNGTFVSSFGSSGLGPGQFLTAVDIDIDNDGNVYVADRGNKKIEKFAANGTYLQSFPFHFPQYVFSPQAITVDPDGNMFVLNSDNNRILHLSQNSSLQLHPADLTGPYPNSFKSITDIEIGINGELLIVDSPTHKIQSYATNFSKRPVIPYFVAPEVAVGVPADQTKPVIVAPPSLTIEAKDLLTRAFIGDANATDASGIKVVINNAPDAFPLGITNVVWIAFDNTGHNSHVYQQIIVNACGNNHSDYNLIKGTADDDVLLGTDGNDLIFGLNGNDVISGGLGNDCIFGGSGNDVISGDAGNDTLRGNSGNDVVSGQSGNDLIFADSGYNVLDGGINFDRCHLGSNRDLVSNCEE